MHYLEINFNKSARHSLTASCGHATDLKVKNHRWLGLKSQVVYVYIAGVPLSLLLLL